jgi:hypothetical protein
MKRTFLVCALLLLAANQGVADEIYRSTDAEGQVVYSDRQPAGKAEVVRVESAPRDEAAALARAERELENIAALDQRRKREALAKAAEKKAAEDAAKKKLQRCTMARNRYLGFMEHSRIYRRDEAGERVYYSAAEIDAERIKSKQRMDEECQ